MKTNSGDQPPDISNTSKQTKFNDFLEQNKGEKKVRLIIKFDLW